MAKILLLSATLGLLQTAFSLLWAFVSYQTGIFKSDLDIFECSTSAQAGVWVQIFIAAELLIFSARTPSFLHRCIAPSPALTASVLLFCLLVSVIACASSFFGSLYVQDVVLIWVYDLVCLLVLDGVKVGTKNIPTVPATVYGLHLVSCTVPDICILLRVVRMLMYSYTTTEHTHIHITHNITYDSFFDI